MGEEESGNPELFYLAEIRQVRDEDTPLFDRIKRLPLKAKSGKRSVLVDECATVTFLRKGYLKMFFKTEGDDTSGITFLEAIKLMQATSADKRIPIGASFFDHLDSNKTAFDDKLVEEETSDFDSVTVAGNDVKAIKLLKALSKCKRFTEPQEEILQKIIDLWQNGEIPANITKNVLKISKNESDELQLFAEICDRIPDRYFIGRNQKREVMIGVKQVILSCWLQNGEAK
jgi:hypothetical protein